MADRENTNLPLPRRRRSSRGGQARQLIWVPHTFCPGDPAAGRRIAEKGIVFGPGEEALTASTLELNPHSFAWLRDLRAADAPGAHDMARGLIGEWLSSHGAYDARTWAPPLLSERIVNWISHFQWYGGGDDFRAAIFESLQYQVSRLRKNARLFRRGVDRVRAAKGLVYVATCVPGFGRRLKPALDIVERELSQNLFEDGGVYERSPSQQFHLLRDLLEIRTVLAGSMSNLPPIIDETISRLTPLVWLTRHCNGTLAQFNGGSAGDRAMISAVLNAAPLVAEVPDRAPRWGFFRLTGDQGANANAIIDAGPPPAAGFDSTAHAGALSFEFCAGGQLVVVNCGSGGSVDRAWREACRATAAHSTLVLANTNSSEIQTGRGIGRKARNVDAEKVRSHDVAWTDCSHDGYVERYRLVHRRRLSLAEDGLGIFGEDRLEPASSRSKTSAGRPFAIRFHLHPDVEVGDVSTGADEASVVLKLPEDGRWVFSSEGADGLELDESVYLGEARPRATRQIILTGETDPDGRANVMWSIAADGSSAG